MSSCAKPTGQDVNRRRLALVVSSLCAIAFFHGATLVGPAWGDDGGGAKSKLVSAGERPAVVRINRLIDQLGDELFAVREEATNQLIRTGIEAKPQLMAALSSSDAEVRFRAKRVLEVVVEGDFQRRLKAFAEDVDGSRKLSLPSWQSFKKFAGEDRAARALFVEMQQAEPQLLEAYESNPAAAAESLAERTQTMQFNAGGRFINQQNRRIFMSAAPAQPSLGSSLAMLFVGGDESVAMKDEVADRFRTALNCNELHTSLAAADDRGNISRKIVGRWIGRESTDGMMLANLTLAMRFDLPQALQPAINTIKRGNAQKTLRYYALVTIGNYGNKELLPAIEPLLKDAEIVYNTNPVVARAGIAQIQAANPQLNSRVIAQTQVRDVALAVSIKLSEQDPKKFGFDLLNMADPKRLPMESSQSRMGFRNEEDRLAAFQKWEEWQKGEKQAAVEKPKSDTIER